MENQDINPGPTTPSPEINQQPMAEPVPQPSEKPNKLLIPLLSVIILALLGSTGFFAYHYFQQSNDFPANSNQPLQTNTPTTPPKTTNAPQNNTTIEWKTFIDDSHGISFDYPTNLKPFELANGVVSFLPEDVYPDCKIAHETEVEGIQVYEPCYKALFNYNGYESNPTEDYETHVQEVRDFATLSTYTDDKNREWKISLVLGQVYNYTAFAEINGTPIKVSFQYGFDALEEDEIFDFFNKVLSSFSNNQ